MRIRGSRVRAAATDLANTWGAGWAVLSARAFSQALERGLTTKWKSSLKTAPNFLAKIPAVYRSIANRDHKLNMKGQSYAGTVENLDP